MTCAPLPGLIAELAARHGEHWKFFYVKPEHIRPPTADGGVIAQRRDRRDIMFFAPVADLPQLEARITAWQEQQ